jgi:hypothetical protein
MKKIFQCIALIWATFALSEWVLEAVIWAIRKKVGVRHVIANLITTTFLLLALIWSRARANVRYGHHPNVSNLRDKPDEDKNIIFCHPYLFSRFDWTRRRAGTRGVNVYIELSPKKNEE